jgi:hypothetical protein
MATKTGKKISDFCGILSKESAEEYEKAIKKNREESNSLRELRIKKITERFER